MTDNQALQEERDEARAAAQQFFEASVFAFAGDAAYKLRYVVQCLDRWPWLRPNAFAPLNEGQDER